MAHNGFAPEPAGVRDCLLTFADCKFSEVRREFFIDGAEIELEAKPHEVLVQLAQHAGVDALNQKGVHLTPARHLTEAALFPRIFSPWTRLSHHTPSGVSDQAAFSPCVRNP